MKIFGLTMARGGSKGVPRKNIRRLGGIPLIAHTINAAKRVASLTDYYVATDDAEIAAVAEEYGANTIMLPPHLTADDVPMLPAIMYAVEEYGECDIVVDLRCTNPLKTSEDIDGAVMKLVNTGADAVIGVTLVEDGHPSRLKQVFRDRLVDVWPEPLSGLRQELRPRVYIRNGSIYAVTREALERGVHIKMSEDVRPYIMPFERSVNIDTELDFALAEVMLERVHDNV